MNQGMEAFQSKLMDQAPVSFVMLTHCVKTTDTVAKMAMQDFLQASKKLKQSDSWAGSLIAKYISRTKEYVNSKEYTQLQNQAASTVVTNYTEL